MIALDEAWLARHPLPVTKPGTNKNDRGRVFCVGGSAFVPGALRLTGEASLRAGAGKLQLGTVRVAAMLLGMFVPEAGVVGLPCDDDGELDADGADTIIEHASSCDTLILGPGMRGSDRCALLLERIVQGLPDDVAILLDAGAITAARDCADALRSRRGAVILTPHHGEMAALSGLSLEAIGEDALAAAQRISAQLDAIVVLKDAATVIAAPGADPLLFEGGTPALATGGSGDVLAGVIGGLLARKAEPIVAAAWGVWAHAAAGAALARELGGPGLLSRDLVARLPPLLNHGER